MARRYEKEYLDEALANDQPLFTLDLFYVKTGRRTEVHGVAGKQLEDAIKAALAEAHKN